MGALWWWGVLRLAFAPDAGALEGSIAAGGWGLSLLPVHCVPHSQAVRALKARGGGRDRRSAEGRRITKAPRARSGRAARARITKAWRRRRSGGGSGPS
ncbi:hypothetical protein CP975_26560 [Streptomyces alboniger]|uniref:Uncharacterized protein n=1 Tax=Streptomyces alboniger TaxID=132473 RepID=A0A5J6HW42_STRAD|nr:hypothetical protein [Streptomyces alboniger]QEV22561.1 hypothetical protein CP975_26560 [Streptomyces alboniger]